MLSLFAPYSISGRYARPSMLDREINRLVEGLSGDPGSPGTLGVPGGITLAADVQESEDAFELHMDLPGVAENDVQVTVENNVLTVKAERRAPEAVHGGPTWHLAERTYGTATRSFRLPRRVDGESATARFDRGVLTVRLNKRAESKPRTIEVKVGS